MPLDPVRNGCPEVRGDVRRGVASLPGYLKAWWLSSYVNTFNEISSSKGQVPWSEGRQMGGLGRRAEVKGLLQN